MLSEAVEDYLKAIYTIQSERGPAKTSWLAKQLGVSAGSVSEMIKRLSQMDPQLVSYTRHRGVLLTAAGEKAALNVIRRHRLLESFLHDVLDFSWDEVHQEADRLEHYITARLTEKIAAYLGHPATDPHGDPIPEADGYLESTDHPVLSEIIVGQTVRIRRIHHSDAQLLKYLEQKGIRPQAVVTMLEKAPLGGPVTLGVGGHEPSSRHSIDLAIADQIFVEVIPQNLQPAGDSTKEP